MLHAQRRGFAAATLSIALTCTFGATAAQAQATDDFYQPPATADAPGTILKNRPANLTIGATVPGGITATTVMYQSRDLNGAPNAVTGTYVEPTRPWTGAGDRPLVVVAPASPGQGDQCAPSRTLQNTTFTPPANLAVEFEPASVSSWASQGYAVFVTDYQGLGTPGTHTYINRVETAHAVLDGARAALRTPAPTSPRPAPLAWPGTRRVGTPPAPPPSSPPRTPPS